MERRENNEVLVSALCRVESVVRQLSERGITVTGIMLRDGQPVIRIARHAWCEYLKSSGKATFLLFGSRTGGAYKQGVFVQDGCKVVWSESIH